jgi:hypothetical protein
VVKLFLIRKPHQLLAVQTTIDNVLLAQPNSAIHSWFQISKTVLAKPFLKFASNPHLSLHSNLPGKLNIPVAALRMILESTFSLREKNLNSFQSNTSLLNGLFTMLTNNHEA